MVIEKGDVKINGISYRVDIPSYRRTDIVDFAPRGASPGGSILMSELGLYQPLMMTDWRHGFGFFWYTDAAGYMATNGRVDTRHAGLAMLFTDSVATNFSFGRRDGFSMFNNQFYSYGFPAGGAGGLSVYGVNSWTDVGGYSTRIVSVLPTSDYLFISPMGQRLRKMSTGGVHSDAGLDANSGNYGWLIMFGGEIYAGKNDSNRIHTSSQNDLGDLEGTPADPDAIYVGAGNFPTIGAAVYGGQLYVFRRDGIYAITNRIAKNVLDYSDQASADNFRSFTIHNGMLVFPIRDRIKQWNGVRTSDITPPLLNDQFPYLTYGRFDNFLTVGDYLFCTGRTNESTFTESLLCYDGIGWHRMADLTSGGTLETVAIGYDPIYNRLFYALSDIFGGGTNSIHYIPFQARSEFPIGPFPTTGTHSLYSSRLDMGFRQVTKSTPSILVEASNVTPTRKLDVYYSLDGGGWNLLGSITNNGVTELVFPGGGTVEYKYLQLRVDFITDDPNQSPILEGIIPRFIMRPNVKYAHNFNIVGASEYEYGRMRDEKTVQQILAELETARDSKAPVTFVDIWGVSRKAYVAQLTTQVVERHVAEFSDQPELETVINVNMVEV